MKRFNSLQTLPLDSLTNPKSVVSKSLPNIDISCTQTFVIKTGKTSRQNSVKKSSSSKIFQKTWDKVKTIIHPSSSSSQSNRRNSGNSSVTNNASPTKHSNSAGNILEPISVPLTVGRKPPASAPSTPSHYKSISTHFDFEDDRDRRYEDEEEDTVIRHYVELQKRLSDELHAAIKDDCSHSHGYGKKHGDSEGLSEDFKKKLQQWDMWKASSGKHHYTDEELQRIIPSDFSKKLQEWETIKCSKVSGDKQTPLPLQPVQQQRKKKKSIITAESSSTDEIRRQKEIAWLDKQLEKIESEKQRLEKELKKYCEREARLEKMREALKNSIIGDSCKNSELWIRTPTAQCKIEGVDEKFITKKLFKWEEKQGIQPESSTIALLSPKYITTTATNFGNTLDQQNSLSRAEEKAISTEFSSLPLSGNEQEEFETNSSTLKSTNAAAAALQEEEPEAFTESESEEDEYTEDSFATNKDERTSGASNTDSECYNLAHSSNKQQNSSSGASGTSCAGCGYRRRSSDAISTPLSTTRSPSLSGCTSDDEENFMLKTVNENEETPGPSNAPSVPKTPILMAKQIQLLDAEDAWTPQETVPIIVKTNRTIFSPVTLHDITPDFDLDEQHSKHDSSVSGLKSPSLVCKTVKENFPVSSSTAGGSSASSPPRIVGAIRKAPIALVSPQNSNNKSPVKIPVWCSPLLSRKKEPKSAAPVTEKYIPFLAMSQLQDFSIDRFLQDTNLIAPAPVASSGLPKLPVVSRLPQSMATRRKYTLLEPTIENAVSPVRLLKLARSNSFQGNRPTQPHQIVRNIPIELETSSQEAEASGSRNNALAASVTKSKSTGSILLSKFGLKSSESKDNNKSAAAAGPMSSKIFWFRNNSSNNNGSND